MLVCVVILCPQNYILSFDNITGVSLLFATGIVTCVGKTWTFCSVVRAVVVVSTTTATLCPDDCGISTTSRCNKASQHYGCLITSATRENLDWKQQEPLPLPGGDPSGKARPPPCEVPPRLGSNPGITVTSVQPGSAGFISVYCNDWGNAQSLDTPSVCGDGDILDREMRVY